MATKTVLVLHKRKTDQRRRSSISGVQNWHAPNRGLKFVKQTYSHITAIVRCAGLSCRSTLSRQGRLPALSGRSTNAHDAAVRPVEAVIGAERSILLPETSARGLTRFCPPRSQKPFSKHSTCDEKGKQTVAIVAKVRPLTSNMRSEVFTPLGPVGSKHYTIT